MFRRSERFVVEPLLRIAVCVCECLRAWFPVDVVSLCAEAPPELVCFVSVWSLAAVVLRGSLCGAQGRPYGIPV